MSRDCPICHTPLVDDVVDVLARTIIGEARGEKFLDMLGVACVVRERALRPGWWGKDITSVCRAPWQFTCWHDHNRSAIERAHELSQWPLAVTVAKLVIYAIRDQDVAQLWGVPNADMFPTHYHDRRIDTPKAWGNDLEEIRPGWSSAFRWYVVRQGRPPRR